MAMRLRRTTVLAAATVMASLGLVSACGQGNAPSSHQEAGQSSNQGVAPGAWVDQPVSFETGDVTVYATYRHLVRPASPGPGRPAHRRQRPNRPQRQHPAAPRTGQHPPGDRGLAVGQRSRQPPLRQARQRPHRARPLHQPARHHRHRPVRAGGRGRAEIPRPAARRRPRPAGRHRPQRRRAVRPAARRRRVRADPAHPRPRAPRAAWRPLPRRHRLPGRFASRRLAADRPDQPRAGQHRQARARHYYHRPPGDRHRTSGPAARPVLCLHPRDGAVPVPGRPLRSSPAGGPPLPWPARPRHLQQRRCPGDLRRSPPSAIRAGPPSSRHRFRTADGRGSRPEAGPSRHGRPRRSAAALLAATAASPAQLHPAAFVTAVSPPRHRRPRKVRRRSSTHWSGISQGMK